ncbi:MAG: dTDP-4-dehydrorhamnose 3,5-epimerase [Anaerolineales bacterium]|nr:dTDP-4-dehydrorhamnose 3,5-epimerase [Anaerolineales bacterium]
MKFTPTQLPDVILVQPRVFEDGRGFFFETYRKDRFSQSGIDVNIVQDNHSASTKGVLRGLHYQIRQPQGKLVRVIVGEVFDVAVDLRRSSPTFGNWVGAILSAEKASAAKAAQIQMATVSTVWKPTQGKRHGEFSEGLSGFYSKAWRVSRETHKNPSTGSGQAWETRNVPVSVCIGIRPPY